MPATLHKAEQTLCSDQHITSEKLIYDNDIKGSFVNGKVLLTSMKN